MAKRKKQTTEWVIVTTYYNGRNVVKTTRAKHAASAASHCFDHMQRDHYAATLAEVFDEDSGDLHAVFRRAIGGVGDPVRVSTVFKRDPNVGE